MFPHPVLELSGVWGVEPPSSVERPPGSGKFKPPRGGVAETFLAHITNNASY